MATAVANNDGWELQGAALLRLRQRLECTGYGRAETEAQAETLTAALVVAVTAAAETKKLRAIVAAEAGRGNEKVCKAKTSPLLLYDFQGSRRVHLQPFSLF